MRRRTRRSGAVLLAICVLVAGVTVVSAGPSGAQDIADLPRLGFEIEPTEGNPGDLVEGWVNTGDVEEHCLSLEEFFDGQIVGGEPVGTGELVRLYGDILAVYDPILLGQEPPPEGLSLQEFETAVVPMALLFIGLGMDPDNLDALYEELFVLTFVDPVSQEMLGEMGNFDPATGEGSIVVPPLDPALYALAAACVTFLPDEVLIDGGLLIETVLVMHDWLEETYPNGPPTFLDPEFEEFVVDAAGVWVPELVDPIAIGIDFYCILNEDGLCATPPGAVELTEELLGDDDPGLAPGVDEPDADDSDELLVEVVDASPAFTG